MVEEGFEPLESDSPLIVYFDIKSPYAFVAKDPTYALADELGIEIDWRPVTLDIPSYLGSARLNTQGKVAESTRSATQWGGVRYAYMDARRYACAWGYGLRGTEKIWDTSLVHIGFSWVKERKPDAVRVFLDLAYPRFWLRDLDVEDIAVVQTLIESCGVSVDGFKEWSAEEGRSIHDAQQAKIFAAGIYGVPGYIHKRDYYFGREHLPHLRQILTGHAPGGVDVAYSLPPPSSLQRLEAGKHAVFLDMQAAASSGRLEITAGVNKKCPQTGLALKTLSLYQQKYGDRLVVNYGEVQPSKSADRQLLAESVGAETTRADAHRILRANYEGRDLQRYIDWRIGQEKSASAKGYAEITINSSAANQLLSNGVTRSFGFFFIDGDDIVHPFNGRQHLFLLEWALENA